jgi:hypothetical protein
MKESESEVLKMEESESESEVLCTDCTALLKPHILLSAYPHTCQAVTNLCSNLCETVPNFI